ncbi:MAG: hypothetical protein ABSE57_22245 [Bryobacteraceae bacterium]|jgi:hypothetical protein
MSSAPESIAATITTDPVLRWYERRASINRENAQRSTGPRTAAGKQRSSRNALSHGLTAASPVLPTEDRAAYQDHRLRFFDEYKPATPTESQLVQELIDTSWRLNRIPLLEAGALARALPPADPEQEATFDIIDAHRALATLGLHGQRLSRQFQKSLEQLREIQSERRREENRELRNAAELLIRRQPKGLPWDPAELFSEQPGFVFSKQQVERHARLLIRQNPAFYHGHPAPNSTCHRAESHSEQVPGNHL